MQGKRIAIIGLALVGVGSGYVASQNKAQFTAQQQAAIEEFKSQFPTATRNTNGAKSTDRDMLQTVQETCGINYDANPDIANLPAIQDLKRIQTIAQKHLCPPAANQAVQTPVPQVTVNIVQPQTVQPQTVRTETVQARNIPGYELSLPRRKARMIDLPTNCRYAGSKKADVYTVIKDFDIISIVSEDAGKDWVRVPAGALGNRQVATCYIHKSQFDFNF